jgi:hypothetical protein
MRAGVFPAGPPERPALDPRGQREPGARFARDEEPSVALLSISFPTREPEREGGALIGGGAQGEVASPAARELEADGESEAGAALVAGVAWIDLDEELEDRLGLGGRGSPIVQW